MSDLAKALAAVQAQLPQIGKNATADTGKYSYTYATLADVSDAVLPLLSAHGLSFVCMPTVTDDGSFVLHYQLLHTSGDHLEGRYPLPLQGGPQAQGSAITYARRYVLTALVGVAPDDDDGQAAQQATSRHRQTTSTRNLIMDRLTSAGVEPAAFAAWLKTTHDVTKVDDLDEQVRMQVVKDITSGDLLDRLKAAA